MTSVTQRWRMADYLYSQAIVTARPGLDFVSQSTENKLPRPCPASGLALGSASFDSASIFFWPFARSELTLNISFIELKSKRLLQRLIKQCEKGEGIQYFYWPIPVFIRFIRKKHEYNDKEYKLL